MAKKEKIHKTNAMRELDRAAIAYELQEHQSEGDISRGLGLRMAKQAGEDPDAAFKTLVCESPSGNHVICCIPVSQELDLKKAAAAAGEKSLALFPWRELESLTGYVRGGCSPIGMKRQFLTLIDETAQLFERISISAGHRGMSLLLSPDDLRDFLDARYADITREIAA